MQKRITVKLLAKELVSRVDAGHGIDCCKEEIKKLARLAARQLPEQTLLVDWKEPAAPKRPAKARAPRRTGRTARA